ncbi:MAG: DNA methyltransferase [Pelagibacterales bacterium]|nr:DNA methyltransferase [Pelagibacterales bacterium]
MRFIGNKENLVDRIYQTIITKDIKGESFFDFFSGTTSVGRYFKTRDYKVISSDLLYFSYVLQRAYITNNEDPKFDKLLKTIDAKDDSLFSNSLLKVINHLNNLTPVKGFIYNNYSDEGTKDLSKPRMYFTSDNSKFIDAVRQKIEEWKESDLISEDEYFILLACLIETAPFYANIAGVYAAFQKKWDPRALKRISLRPISIIKNSKQNVSYNTNSVELIDNITADIIYLDPPYNQRQYAPNYHLLETIAKYDNPKISGVAGLRNYDKQKSKFCNAKTALEELKYIANTACYKYLILSYNSEGIMKTKDIISTLEQFGKVETIEFDYLRFKSNSNGNSKNKKFVQEQLYILKNEK